MKKKLLILISMLAMMFSLTACSNEVEKPFDYDDSQIVIDTMYLFNQYQNVDDEYADYPDCFSIDKYEIDHTEWNEGFFVY